MRRKLILHIGTEKTGTTTIQEFLYLNRDMLMDKGIYIPEELGYKNHRKLATICMAEGHTDDHHQAMGLRSKKQIDNWSNTQKQLIVNELSSIEQPVTIISSEHFSSRLISEEEVKSLYDLLSNVFDEIQVILYLRRQDKYAVSLYSTALKNGAFHRQILLDSVLKERYDYQYITSLWDKYFGNLNVRVFDRKELKDGDLLVDFLSVFDVFFDSDFVIPQPENPSLSQYAQEFLIAWNKNYPKYTENGVDPRHEEMVNFLEKNFSGKPRLPIRKHVKDWMNKYHASNKIVANKYLNREYLFDDDYESYPTEYTTLDSGKEILKFCMEQFVDSESIKKILKSS